ncbi:MAG TPA: 5-formyltetrahydrofolate cyclo-ligase [Cytophagales bacterium]|nr:5-formyltetrahydrofolate cyclo-ligase [Cytophagales bacterium]
MTKADIRKKYLNLRLALSEEEWSFKSQAISNNFFSMIDVAGLHTVHIYLPLILKKEPNTHLIIDRLQKEFPKIQISIPRIENDQLINFYYEDENQLKKNRWGILEPAYGKLTPVEKIDLVIVPLLAYDSKGNRVGYGKGYYDRFLKQCRTDCKRVGLSFFVAEPESIRSESHDAKLSGIITPKYFNTFG